MRVQVIHDEPVLSFQGGLQPSLRKGFTNQVDGVGVNVELFGYFAIRKFALRAIFVRSQQNLCTSDIERATAFPLEQMACLILMLY
ncbi:hypothetical protein D3C77_456680 [compost metagenome]